MLDLLRKTYLVGLGLASLTKEKLEVLVDEAIERGEVAEKDRRKMVDDLLQKARQEQQQFSQAVKEGVNKVIAEMRLPKLEQFDELKQRVAELERQVLAKEEKEQNNAQTSSND